MTDNQMASEMVQAFKPLADCAAAIKAQATPPEKCDQCLKPMAECDCCPDCGHLKAECSAHTCEDCGAKNHDVSDSDICCRFLCKDCTHEMELRHYRAELRREGSKGDPRDW